MKNYVVCREQRMKGCSYDQTETIYWKGTLTEHGYPSWSKYVNQAQRFDSARQAYDICGEIESMQWWKVVKREFWK